MNITDLVGLLGPSPEDKQSALNMGLLQAGLGILARNTDRNNPLPAIAGGAMQGLQGYQGALKQARDTKLDDLSLRLKLAELAKVKKDPTPASIQEYNYAKEGGYTGDFQSWLKEKESFGKQPPQAASSIQEYNFAKEGGYKGTFEQWIKDKAAAGRAPAQPAQPYFTFIPTPEGIMRGNARTGELGMAGKGVLPVAQDPTLQGQVASAKEGGKAGVEMNTAEFQAVSNAYKALPAMTKLETLIESGQYNAGTAAQLRQGMDKALALLGGKDAALRASNTELVKALSGSGVFPLIQSLGIGARGLDTPAEREFLLDVMVGTINMEPAALLAITKDRKNLMQQSIESFNSRVQSGELDNWFKSTGRAKKTFDINAGQGKTTMDTLPPAQQHMGKTVRDTKTGKLLRSNGMSWVPVGG